MLRLLETFRLEEVQSAARDAIRLGALSFDAVKHVALCRLEGRPPRLDLCIPICPGCGSAPLPPEYDCCCPGGPYERA